MTDEQKHLIRARLAHWPGGRYACAMPLEPEHRDRFWLLDQTGRVVATFVQYRLGRFPLPKGARR